jgi:hypothetical protein
VAEAIGVGSMRSVHASLRDWGEALLSSTTPTTASRQPRMPCDRRGHSRTSQCRRKVFTQDREYTTKQRLDELPTYSDHRSLPPDQRHLLLEAVGDVIDEEGGRFVMKYESVLVSGMRTS